MTRRIRLLAAGLAVIAALGSAACTAQIPGDGRLVSPSAPSPVPTRQGDGGGDADVRQCPRIVDSAASLTYDCLDPSFTEIPLGADPSFADGSIRMAFYTEPTWLAGQQSGALTLKSASAQYVALLLAAQQTADNYGQNPTSQTQLGTDVAGLGESAYRIDLLVTLDPAYAQGRGLAVRSERLCVVVVEVAPGDYSAMTMSVPDTRQDLWPAYDAVVASIDTV